MVEEIVVEPMTEEFLLWRCLHYGPLSRGTIDRCPPDSGIDWGRYRLRNVPLLLKLTRTYGACAIVARDKGRVVGQLRFYPRAVWNLEGAGGLCLQQDSPAGPADTFPQIDFPAPALIEDRTLAVHCMMTGSSLAKENPYQWKGIGTRMVGAMIRWAKAHGWNRIEADSFEDIPVIYEITGCAGLSFWEKMGFTVAERYPHPDLKEHGEHSPFIETLKNQAQSVGIPPERARDKIVMRLEI